MKSKTLLTVVGVFVALILLAGSCSAGYITGWSTASRNPTNNAEVPDLSTTQETTPDQQELIVPFWEAWDIVKNYFVNQPVDEEKMMQGAIRGMLESLGDEHTLYMDPFEYKDATASLSGEYEGIGAWVNTEGEYLTIAEPMPGSPAEQAGLLPGDEIIAIDREDMTGVLPELARQKVLGPKGTAVLLTIRRPGVEEPFDVSVTRASIKVASVDSSMLDEKIAYIKIRNFGDKTTSELRTALKGLLKQNPIGIILDLRNNPGGLLPSAIEVASEFIGEGVILYEEYGDGTQDIHQAIQGGLATDIPLVVLVNQYSASASEVVAGAIQDSERGVLVGITTFGKGTVQSWIPLSNEQGAVRVTIARWLTPDRRQIVDVGLTPDVEIDRTDEDIQADLDPQLDKAIELLLEK